MTVVHTTRPSMASTSCSRRNWAWYRYATKKRAGFEVWCELYEYETEWDRKLSVDMMESTLKHLNSGGNHHDVWARALTEDERQRYIALCSANAVVSELNNVQ